MATRRHISEEGILHSHRREHLKSYICFGSPTYPMPRGSNIYVLAEFFLPLYLAVSREVVCVALT
jgi:hypothetical protein